LGAITAAERAVTARAVLLPSHDRYVVQALICGFGAGVRDLNLVRIRIHGVIVIGRFPGPEIGGSAIAGERERSERK